MENTFLTDNDCRVILSIGSKGSFKTTLLLNYIRYALAMNLYDRYFLVLPQFHNKSGQYEFLSKYKQMTIYNNYTQRVSNDVLKNCNGKIKVFFAVDDATSKGLEISKDMKLLHILSTTRHLNCQVWLLLHASRRVLSVPIRSLVDYMFIHKVSNRKLLESLWEEFLSMKDEFFEFKKFSSYYNNILNSDCPILFLDFVRNSYEHINRWEYVNNYIPQQKTQENKVVEKKEENIKKKFSLVNIISNGRK